MKMTFRQQGINPLKCFIPFRRFLNNHREGKRFQAVPEYSLKEALSSTINVFK
jgi:hypothetical protein